MTLYTDTFETTFGLFSAAVDDNSAVVATAFGDATVLRSRLSNAEDIRWQRDPERTGAVRAQVEAFANGALDRFTLPLQPIGSAFQQSVWRALLEIPCGETRSYADLARRIGTAPRAVGQANARNPICLVVPCHRVVGASGALTGFAFGTPLKEQLIAHERRMVAIRKPALA